MMTKTTSTKMLLFRKLALIPVLSGMIYLFCIETVAQNKNQTSKVETQKSKQSDDKKRDIYFAGVRFKVYKDIFNSKNERIRKDLIMDKRYEELTPDDKNKFKIWFPVPKALVKKSPTAKELEAFKDNKKYAIWIDGKNVQNSELNKYKPSDIASFSGSAIMKNAQTKKHPQPYQFDFFTHTYFDKNVMGKEQTKYPGAVIEISDNYQEEIIEKITLKVMAKNTVELEEEKNTLQTENQLYTSAEKKPDFPGGLKAFYEFVGQNYKAPDANVKGKVYIQFVVEADGSLSNFEVMRDIGHGTGEEAVRVMKLSPKWIPGEQDGKKVRVLYSLPISIQAE